MQNSDGSDGDLRTLCCVLIECSGMMTNGIYVVIPGYYTNLTRSVELTLRMARGNEVLFVATGDRLQSQMCGNVFIFTD